MILRMVGHLVPYLGVSYANDPKKGGYMAYAPALDLTTSLQGDSYVSSMPVSPPLFLDSLLSCAITLIF